MTTEAFDKIAAGLSDVAKLKVVPMKPNTAHDSISAELRDIADKLDSGHFPVEVHTCIVSMGHVGLDGPVDECASHKAWTYCRALGPRQDVFTVLGLLSQTSINMTSET